MTMQKSDTDKQAYEKALAKVGALPPQVQEDITLGKIFALSGMFPDVRTASQGIVKVMAGRELGLAPIISMSNIYLFGSSGRVTLMVSTPAVAAMAAQKGITWEIVEHDDQHCKLTINRPGRKPHTETYTFADATKAGLTRKDNWQNHPKNMVYWRALRNAIRVVAPDIMLAIKSVGASEELMPEEEKADAPPVVAVANDDVTEGDFQEAVAPMVADKEAADNAMADFGFGDDSPKPAVAGSAAQPAASASAVVPSATEQGAGQQGRPGASQRNFSRPPEAVKSYSELLRACNIDFHMQPKDVYAELNVNNQSELTETPQQCYIRIAAVHAGPQEQVK